MSGGGSADAADARGSGRIIQPSFLMGFVGLRAHGPETQLMLMMLVLGGVPTAENLVNTECFVGPRKNAPKIAHFTRSNGLEPTKHPNSRTPNALSGSCFWGFRGHASVQAHTIGVFKGVLDGLGEAADAHDAPFPGSQKASQAQKHVFTAFSEGFSKAKRSIECF